MGIKALPVELTRVDDLVRLVADVRRERSVLLGYESGDGYELGFYLPPQMKDVQAVFVYARLGELPRIVSYSPNDAGREVITYEYVDSPAYIPIPVVRVAAPPHEYVGRDGLKVNIVEVFVDDMASLINVAYSTLMENALIPFVWFIEGSSEYVVNVEAASDDEDYIVLFKYRGEVPGSPFIEYDMSSDEYRFVDVVSDVTKRYVLAVRVGRFMV